MQRTLADPGDETRTRIMAVALQLIAERGFAATSTREIAERLGLTKAALYYHFRTKDDLLAEILRPAQTDLEALLGDVPAEASHAERRAVVAGLVDLVMHHADLFRVLANDPTTKHSAAASAPALQDRLTEVLSGSVEPAARPRARVRVRAALGAVLWTVLRADPGDDPEMLRAEAFAAACGVLEIPAARRPKEARR